MFEASYCTIIWFSKIWNFQQTFFWDIYSRIREKHYFHFPFLWNTIYNCSADSWSLPGKMATSRAGQSLNRPLDWKPELRADISESDFQRHTNSAPVLRARMSGKSSLRFAPYGKALLRERNILAERREKDCLSRELEVGRWEVVQTMNPTHNQANLSCSGGNIGQL